MLLTTNMERVLDKVDMILTNTSDVAEVLAQLKSQREGFSQDAKDIRICVEGFGRGLASLTDIVNKLSSQIERLEKKIGPKK